MATGPDAPSRADFAARVIAETALAITDGIVFRRGGEVLGVAEFEAVRAALGSELEPLAVYPRRLLGRTFPADWQLGKMGLVPWRHREGGPT